VTFAASLIVVTGVGYGVSHHGAPEGIAFGAASVRAVAARTYTTAPRERAELRLPDGTRVRLAPVSRLRVGTDFGDQRRDVFLDGQGHFEVTHDAQRPFTVFAGTASVRDLGASFAVRSYPEDGATQVVVREGTVALSGVGRLTAGELGRLTAEGVGARQRVDVAAALGWLEGRLVFAGTPLGGVLQELRRWHDVQAEVPDPVLLARPFTGTLDEASPDDAVAQLAAALALDVRRDGGRVLLRARAAERPAAASTR
jgi:transmembrane sensor